jgi:hypothetical protein
LKLSKFHLKWIFPICPLNFWHLAIGSLWKSFFLILPLDQLQLNPWISTPVTKQFLVPNFINSVLNWLFNLKLFQNYP